MRVGGPLHHVCCGCTRASGDAPSDMRVPSPAKPAENSLQGAAKLHLIM